jgi:hypothetical protein
MRRRGLVSVAGVVAAGFLLAFAGAGVAMQLDRGDSTSLIRVSDVDPAKVKKAVKQARANLRGRKLMRLLKSRNRPALLRFLKKNYGIDPKRVVIQRGARNYAGPKCPGKRWNCTRARQVVQYSAFNGDDDDENRFTCTPSDVVVDAPQEEPPAQACAIIQVGPGDNNATCRMHGDQAIPPPGATQFCDIDQMTANGNNRATIEQGVDAQNSGSEQEVLQEAFLNQSTVNGSNSARIVQETNLLLFGASPQEQDVHQLVDADMDTQFGDNVLSARQDQDLVERSNALAVEQLQNTDFDTSVDCDGEGMEPDAPNSCADIDMTTLEGDNLLTGGDDDDDNGDDGDNGDNGAGFDNGVGLSSGTGLVQNTGLPTLGGGTGGSSSTGDDDDDDVPDDNGAGLVQRNELHMSVGGGGDDGGDDNGDDGDDDNGGSGTITGFEQQGTCVGGDLETDPADPTGTGCVSNVSQADGGTEASINMFSIEEGRSISHMTGQAIEHMPTNQPSINQLQFADPGCCFGTFFLGSPALATMNLIVVQQAGPNAYQDGENVVGCAAAAPDESEGTCRGVLTVDNNDGTFTVEAEGPAIFGKQDCTSGPAAPSGGPTCEGATVVTVTTTTVPIPGD